jgi:hypothetical protein
MVYRFYRYIVLIVDLEAAFSLEKFALRVNYLILKVNA